MFVTGEEVAEGHLQNKIDATRREVNRQEEQHKVLKKDLEYDGKDSLHPLEEQLEKQHFHLATMEKRLLQSTNSSTHAQNDVNDEGFGHAAKLGNDMANQLKRVSIPMLRRDKTEYPRW